MNDVAGLLAQIHDELRAINERLSKVTKERDYVSLRFWSLMSALMTVTLALALLIGPDLRVSSSGYWGISTFGGPQAWGVAFFVTSVATLLAVWQAPNQLRWTLIAQSVPYAGLSVSFLVSAIRFDDANLTATPVYGWVAVMTLCLAEHARRCARDRAC